MSGNARVVIGVAVLVSGVILGAAAVYSFVTVPGTHTAWRLAFRPLCHQRAERCLDLFGTRMPICARCTGIYAGMAVAGGLALVTSGRTSVGGAAALMLVAPLAVDGVTQAAGIRESTNMLRMVTGTLAGAALVLWLTRYLRSGRERSRASEPESGAT